MRQRLLLNVCDGAVVLPHRIQDVGRGSSAFEALDGCAMRVVGECLPGRSIVLEENIPEGPPVTAGLDDGNRIALESGDDLPVACPLRPATTASTSWRAGRVEVMSS